MSNAAKKRRSPNVYGIETEYSCLLILDDETTCELVGACHSVDEAVGVGIESSGPSSEYIPVEQFDRALTRAGLRGNEYGLLSNGGRLYQDPSGYEYATPETTTAREAVLRSFEGDRVLTMVLSGLMKSGVIRSYQLNRHGVDHNQVSRGVHLNTSTTLSPEDSTDDEVVKRFGALNVAKGALFGAGGLLISDQGVTEFHHSPRLSVTDSLVPGDGTRWEWRPLVRVPFNIDVPGLMRAETITSDALNFGWPLRASLVVTNALTSLIELGRTEGLPRLHEAFAVDSAHNVGRDGGSGVMCTEGNRGQAEERYAIDVLAQITAFALHVHTKSPYLDQESEQVLAEISDAIQMFKVAPGRLADQVESIGRWTTMQKRMERLGIGIDSEKMCRLDYAWDWIGGAGLAEALKRRGKGWQGFGQIPGPSATRTRLVTPPKDTRAWPRGRSIADGTGDNISDWCQPATPATRNYVHPLETTF